MKPNFVIFLSDEEAYPYYHENDEIKIWRKKNLPLNSFLKENGLEFNNHFINNSGCRPSRADLNTGMSHRKHKVIFTDGLAKNEEDVMFIDPQKTPTLGTYLKNAGYNTYYKGKQHFKYINDNSTDNLASHGFDNWDGPEAHGPTNFRKSTGYFRDTQYTQSVLDLLPNLKEPYCLFISLLNPHDIVFFTAYNMQKYPIGKLIAWFFGIPQIGPEIDETLPHCEDTPTQYENLDFKPSAQKSFREVYKQILSKPFYKYFHSDFNILRRFYYTLIKDVQQNFWKIFCELKKYKSFENTFFIYTSDHGELLGNHGGLFQKWYNMYQESIHVPFYIYHPKIKKYDIPFNVLSCHHDIVPTILGLANIKTYTKFDGKNLAPFILQKRSWNLLKYRRINFHCFDDITNGTENYPIIVKRTKIFYKLGMFKYKPVRGPRYIKAQIKSTGDKIYKYAIYFDPQDKNNIEEEMYEITNDKYEKNNLIYSPYFKKLKKNYFKPLLKRLKKKFYLY